MTSIGLGDTRARSGASSNYDVSRLGLGGSELMNTAVPSDRELMFFEEEPTQVVFRLRSSAVDCTASPVILNKVPLETRASCKCNPPTTDAAIKRARDGAQGHPAACLAPSFNEGLRVRESSTSAHKSADCYAVQDIKEIGHRGRTDDVRESPRQSC